MSNDSVNLYTFLDVLMREGLLRVRRPSQSLDEFMSSFGIDVVWRDPTIHSKIGSLSSPHPFISNSDAHRLIDALKASRVSEALIKERATTLKPGWHIMECEEVEDVGGGKFLVKCKEVR